MRLKWILLLCLLLAVLPGCQRGDGKISLVIEGQPAPHAGYNIGPELYLLPGDPAKVTGAVVWLNNLDPNDLLRSE